MLHDRKLYKRNYEGVYLKCLGREQEKEVLEFFYNKYGRRHCLGEANTHFILRLGYC